MKIRYFVVFATEGMGIGNNVVVWPRPVTGINDVRGMEQLLREQMGASWLTITHFQQLPAPLESSADNTGREEVKS